MNKKIISQEISFIAAKHAIQDIYKPRAEHSYEIIENFMKTKPGDEELFDFLRFVINKSDKVFHSSTEFGIYPNTSEGKDEQQKMMTFMKKCFDDLCPERMEIFRKVWQIGNGYYPTQF